MRDTPGMLNRLVLRARIATRTAGTTTTCDGKGVCKTRINQLNFSMQLMHIDIKKTNLAGRQKIIVLSLQEFRGLIFLYRVKSYILLLFTLTVFSDQFIDATSWNINAFCMLRIHKPRVSRESFAEIRDDVGL